MNIKYAARLIHGISLDRYMARVNEVHDRSGKPKAIIFMDIKNIDLVGLVLGNYMFITLAILTGMIYKNEAIYWYTGISYQEACAVTSKQRKEYAYKHFIRFLMVCLGYFVYSIIAYFLSFSFGMSIIICCLLMTVCALSTVSIKL